MEEILLMKNFISINNKSMFYLIRTYEYTQTRFHLKQYVLTHLIVSFAFLLFLDKSITSYHFYLLL